MPKLRRSFPRVCVIDENPKVEMGWRKSLGKNAQLYFFRDPLEFQNAIENDLKLLRSFTCIIFGRNFSEHRLDIVKSRIPQKLAKQTDVPLFLNWQGYVSKADLETQFDGKIFHRFGIKWHTLKLRIQRLQRQKETQVTNFVRSNSDFPPSHFNRDQKCQHVLRQMAKRAHGEHRSRIEYYAQQDQETGVRLLEAIYNELLTNKNRSDSCPSRYINSSPVIATKILSAALQ